MFVCFFNIVGVSSAAATPVIWLLVVGHALRVHGRRRPGGLRQTVPAPRGRVWDHGHQDEAHRPDLSWVVNIHWSTF